MMLANDSLFEALQLERKTLLRKSVAPLDEQQAYDAVDAYYKREGAMRAIAEVAFIDDDALLGRLLDAGFTPKTLPALQLSPIAFVAWASDSVTEAECQAAVAAICETHLFNHPAAAAKVQTWLDIRPTQALWDLWVDYTECRISQSPTILQQTMARQLLRQATQVAIASGGFMGFGGICKAESKLLDEIRNVFYGRD